MEGEELVFFLPVVVKKEGRKKKKKEIEGERRRSRSRRMRKGKSRKRERTWFFLVLLSGVVVGV